MYKLIDYYLSIVMVTKENNIPDDISGNIFSFLKKDIIKTINDEYILLQIKKYKERNKCLSYKMRFTNDFFIMHTIDLPYHKNLNIHELHTILLGHILETNCNLLFSHYCCSNVGIVFKHPNMYTEQSKRLGFI